MSRRERISISSVWPLVILNPGNKKKATYLEARSGRSKDYFVRPSVHVCTYVPMYDRNT